MRFSLMLVPLLPSHSYDLGTSSGSSTGINPPAGAWHCIRGPLQEFLFSAFIGPFLQNSMFWSEVVQSCLTPWDPMDSSSPGSGIHGIFQAIILELVAISFSRGSPQFRDWPWVSCIAGRLFTIWDTRYSICFGANQIFPIHWDLAVFLFQVSQNSHTIIFLTSE